MDEQRGVEPAIVADMTVADVLPSDALSRTDVFSVAEARGPLAAERVPGDFPPNPQRRGLAKSASLIMLGNLVSSVLGMVRLLFLNILFYGQASGAFTVALRPVQQVSDLIVGGSVSGALIPTFVDYSAERQRAELRRVYCTVANLVSLLMLIGCAGIVVAAPYFIPFETQNFTPADQQLTIRLVQIAAVSLLGLGLYTVGSALLYALKEVVYPAFATGIYHVAILLCGTLVLLYALNQAGVPLAAALQPGSGNPAVDLAREYGANGLAAGAVLGTIAEFVLLLPALRRLLGKWQPVLDLRHPAVRQILRLYVPLLGGLVFSVILSNVEVTLIGLTSGGAPENATSLASATTLIQFPVGLVSSALSFSVLPLLVPAATSGDLPGYKKTLRLGLRLALLLMVPAAVGLILLRVPIVSLLFQHGACSHACTYRNALALQNLAYQLPFVATNQLLIAAFFARKNTLAPVLLGIAAMCCYFVLAPPLALALGLPGVAFANGLPPTISTVLLYIVLSRRIGDLGLGELLSGVVRILAAAGGMAGVCIGLLWLLPQVAARFFSLDTSLGALLMTAVVGLVGATVYFALASVLRVDEVRVVVDFARARFGRRFRRA